jgi:hypothetical protein
MVSDGRRDRGTLQQHRPELRGRQDRLYTRSYADANGFLTLLGDGRLLTGAYALGPEVGERLQQAIVAIRAPPLHLVGVGNFGQLAETFVEPTGHLARWCPSSSSRA